MNMSATTAAIDGSGEYAFSDDDFQTIADFAKAKFGLDLQPSKKPLVYSRLSKRLRILGFEKFSEYCEFIKTRPDDPEIDHLLSALTTNVTHFFREKHHFDFLAQTVAPDLIARAKKGEAIRLWSAACSAGQEAYCIAAVLLSVDPRVADLDIRILATDIDPKMIKAAKEGSYSADQKAAIPAEFHRLMLADGKAAGRLVMSDPLRTLISFNELNLIDAWPMRRKLDVVFCRNAAIYFDKKTQATLWNRFAGSLKEGGYLMIGHSERLSGPAEDQFQSAGITTYLRKPADGLSTRQHKEME